MISVDKKIRLLNGSWSFSSKGLSESFAEHIKKSIPAYTQGHELICELSDFFIHPHSKSKVYDLGCSVGELTKKIAQRHKKKDLTVIGFDREEQMIEKSKENTLDLEKITFLCQNFLDYSFKEANLFISYYTLQFLSLKERKQILTIAYKALKEGGAFIVFEKVLETDAFEQDIFSNIYHSFKLSHNFSANEIIAKEQSLKGVMKLQTREENFKMFRESGFRKTTLLMKNLHFEGYLLRK